MKDIDITQLLNDLSDYYGIEVIQKALNVVKVSDHWEATKQTCKTLEDYGIKYKES